MSDDSLGAAAHSFSKEIEPQKPADYRPRDIKGKFVESSARPEPMFDFRPVEGDPVTGDTRDGGDNAGLRAREQEIADGRVEESGRRAVENAQNLRRSSVDEGHVGTEIEPEDIWDIAAEGDDVPRRDVRAEGDRSDAEGDAVSDVEGEKYEVTADGETFHVTLAEALKGYSREQTFHKRMGQLQQAQQEHATNLSQLQANWAWWDQARRAYEEDVANMLPAEPNWDHEFARDPAAAHAQQKIFQTIYSKLAASQQARAQREEAATLERDRQVQKYAVDGFTKFVMDNKIPDEATLKKNLQSMRRTASALGFSEYEVATVYDPRMLSCLLKASRYDRMMAARPRAVVPGKGRTLPPGAATPLSGNGPRKGLDEALRRQASSGRLEDTAEVFRRLL